MGFGFDWGISVAKKIMESAFLTSIRKAREKRTDLRVFANLIQEKAKEITGDKQTGMVHEFTEQDHVYDLLRKTLIVEDREGAIKEIRFGFKNFSRGTFELEAKADECIDYAVSEFLRLRGNEQQRNDISLSNQITKLGSFFKPTIDIPNEQLIVAFISAKDKILCEENFYDYNHAIEHVSTMWKNNHIIQIVGPPGSGKKQIIAHLLFNERLTIYIKAANINSIELFVAEMSTRIFSGQIMSTEAIIRFFEVNQGYTIVLTDMRSIDAKFLDYLNRFPSKIIFSSTELIVSGITTYVNHLPSIEQGIKIYSGYRNIQNDSDEGKSGLDIRKIIEEAGRIPECIRFLALYQSYIDNEIDLLDFAAAIRKDETSTDHADDYILSPKEYIKTKIIPKLNIKKEMLEVLKVVTIFPDRIITKKLLQLVIDYFSEKHLSYFDFMEKGLGFLKTMDGCEVFSGSSLICDALEIKDEDFNIHLFYLFQEYVQSFIQSDDYKLMEIYEACEMGEHLYSRMNEEQPDSVWNCFLVEKAGLYELLGLHLSCIKECNRILLDSEIKKYPNIEIKTRVTLSKALAEYGLLSEASDVISSIPMDLTNDDDRERLNETKHIIEVGFHEYEKTIAETKANLSDNPYVRVRQFHQLATMNYYKQNLVDAEEYFLLACSLIEELFIEESVVAGMIYAAGSAIYLAADKSDKAILFGERSLKITLGQNKGVNSHILTSYNNLANAYLLSGQYTLAEKEYMYIIENYREILSPTSPMVIHARVCMEMCRIMDENEYDSKSLEILMIDLAKNKENYKLAVEVILSFGIYAIEDRNFVTLKRILDITNQWIGEFIDYPQIENCYVFMNRLIFAEQTASLHLVNSSFEENNHEGNQSFKTLWEMIKQGSFDNIEDQLEYIEGKTATIPVYSNMDIISDDIGDSPVYWVFSTFPPKDAYMGLIISDDSMLPIIQKGDLVWIQKKKPKSGDITICRIENEKRWVIGRFEKIDGKDMLIPDNKEYKSFLLGKVEKEEIKGIMVDFENG